MSDVDYLEYIALNHTLKQAFYIPFKFEVHPYLVYITKYIKRHGVKGWSFEHDIELLACTNPKHFRYIPAGYKNLNFHDDYDGVLTITCDCCVVEY